jgi:hypothetical protein
LPYDRPPSYDGTPKIITPGGLANKDCPIGVHMLPYHQMLGDKKLHLAFFIVPTIDVWSWEY